MRAPLPLALSLALAGACWTGPAPAPPPLHATAPPPAEVRPALYERIGGRSGIRAIVGEAISNLAADRRINIFFANSDIVVLRKHLEDWLCAASGGPCRYTGKTMRATHLGMGVGGEDFEAFVEAFAKAADQLGVKGRDKVELVLAVRRPRADIVER
jgi:hemoglobin